DRNSPASDVPCSRRPRGLGKPRSWLVSSCVPRSAKILFGSKFSIRTRRTRRCQRAGRSGSRPGALLLAFPASTRQIPALKLFQPGRLPSSSSQLKNQREEATVTYAIKLVAGGVLL